ncbi:MAG: deoxyribodipyrimidine photo-lyase, partial [Candidatus Nanohaloarchaea archaeon]|nr:deoxyribodipyrimidine photo-lyase [Candidatus Nanohaloarchaea archaeon]
MTAIAWLRRAMRVPDNTALVRAAEEHDAVVPVYVVDTDLFADRALGYPRVRFWHGALHDLQDQLDEHGSRLVVRHGTPVEELRAVVDAADADAVFYNRDYTPYARDRDERVAAALDVPATAVKDLAMHDRDEIMTNSGSPYRVYSYYRDKWFDRAKQGPSPAPSFTTPTVASDDIPSRDALGVEEPDGFDWVWTPTRQGGLARLDAFRERIGDYDEMRDEPAADATSRISPHLKFGTVSVREAFQAAEAAREAGADRDGVRVWEEELAWRDFYFQVLWHWPETV